MAIAASMLLSAAHGGGGGGGASNSHHHHRLSVHPHSRHRLPHQPISDVSAELQTAVARRRAVDSSDLRSCAIVQSNLKTIKVFPG